MEKIRTERLVLRDWRESDLTPWAEMNADPEVREHLGPLLGYAETTATARQFQEDLDRNGYGFWAVELRETGAFIGVAGLDDIDEETPISGVEAGWRLTRSAWGNGYATEAASAALGHGFDTIRLAEIVAITRATNLRSQAVMRRLGMTTDPADDHDDPHVKAGPPQRLVVYRKRRPDR